MLPAGTVVAGCDSTSGSIEATLPTASTVYCVSSARSSVAGPMTVVVVLPGSRAVDPHRDRARVDSDKGCGLAVVQRAHQLRTIREYIHGGGVW